jgi:hypothetical protein
LSNANSRLSGLPVPRFLGGGTSLIALQSTRYSKARLVWLRHPSPPPCPPVRGGAITGHWSGGIVPLLAE